MYLDRLTPGRDLRGSSLDLDKKYICISTFDRIILLSTMRMDANHDNGIKIMRVKRKYNEGRGRGGGGARIAKYLVKKSRQTRGKRGN